MPLNGSGSYTPPAPEFPAVPNTLILSSDFNAIINDLAASLSLAIFRDGQAPWTADQPMAGFRFTGLGQATMAGHAVEFAQYTTLTDSLQTQINAKADTTVTDSLQTQVNTKASLTADNTFLGSQDFTAAAAFLLGAAAAGVTAAPGDQSTKLATTQFTANAVSAAIAAIGYRDVVFITAAMSPYTITQADSGKLIAADTSVGSVVIDLPLISGLSLPFNCGVKKTTTDANVLTVNTAPGNTFDDGTTSKAITTSGGLTLLPDIDPAPDVWVSINFGGINAGPITGSGLTASSDTLVGRLSPGVGSLEEIPHATLAEMQAGTEVALRGMSPANVAQAITALVPAPVAEFQFKSTSFAATSGTTYMVGTAAGPVTATLPAAPVAGDFVSFYDALLKFGTNNLTIDGNGQSFQDAAGNSFTGTFVMDVTGVSINLAYDGTYWRFSS